MRFKFTDEKETDMMRKKLLVNILTALTLFAANAVHACPEDWMGMGPGMMGDYGMGHGMMGPGMMGMGPGMMGYGMMGGYGPGNMPNLDESQQRKVVQIQDELRKKHWDLMGKMNDEQAKLNQLYYSGQRDPAAIGKQQQRVYDLRRQMMESMVEAQNRMEAVLTPEQKEQRRGYGRGWMTR